MTCAAMGCIAVVVPPAFLRDVDLVAIILSIVLLIVSLSFHELSHAWVAWKCGDPTGKNLGRITLNPLAHIDPFMTVLLPGVLLMVTGGGFLFGGAKPVPVDYHRLRHPMRDMTLVAAAGPFSNLLLAVVFLAGYKFFVDTGLYREASEYASARRNDLLPSVLFTVFRANVLLAVFNMLPIPPLDGSRIMTWVLPSSLRESYLGFERFGMIAIFALILYHPFNVFLDRTVSQVSVWIAHLVSLGGAW